MAHRYHTSLTRIDYNTGEKSLEITIQTFSHDLEAALEAKTGKRFNIQKTRDATKIILDYLAETFVLKNKSGETKQLEWVGIEQKTDGVWIHLETKMPEGMEGATLENRFLFEMFNEQVNLVAFRFEGKKNDLVYKAGDKTKSLVKLNK